MNRRIYMAMLKTNKEDEGISKFKHSKEVLQRLSNDRKLENPSIFKYENYIFLYYEFCGEEILPEVIFSDISKLLESWPGDCGKRSWVPMYDVFHYQAPQSSQEWRRKVKIETPTPWGRVVRLKPDMLSSYIFYHFQYQEEKPGDGDKYGMIVLHENLLFFYCENPVYKELPSYKGLLNTSNTPTNWAELMEKHFKAWSNPRSNNENWRDTELLVSLP